MKMKKTKLLIPAIGMLVFTSAASVSGTVAWFTANQVFAMTAGEFAVVNTKDNLQATLADGVGTVANNASTPATITVSSGYSLTDGSLAHYGYATVPTIVTPDETGTKVETTAGAKYGLVAINDGTLAAKLVRDSTNHIYTAFTWDITFTVTFAQTATKPLGLYFDASKSIVSEVQTFTARKATAADVGTYYTDVKRTTGAVTVAENDDLTAGKFYSVPDDTGKAFRLGIVPKTIPTGSLGLVKVWADNQTTANAGYVHNIAEGSDLAKTLYTDATHGTHTLQLVDGTWSAATIGSGKALMDSSYDEAVPDEQAHSAALSGSANYLGYFGVNAGGSTTLTFTCVAWYDGTDPNITSDVDTVYETVASSLEFGVKNVTL